LTTAAAHTDEVHPFTTSDGIKLNVDESSPTASLRMFAPRLSSTGIVKKVTVKGWNPETKELILTQLHPGVSAEEVREATGWDLRLAAEPRVTEPPSPDELGALRELIAR